MSFVWSRLHLLKHVSPKPTSKSQVKHVEELGAKFKPGMFGYAMLCLYRALMNFVNSIHWTYRVLICCQHCLYFVIKSYIMHQSYILFLIFLHGLGMWIFDLLPFTLVCVHYPPSQKQSPPGLLHCVVGHLCKPWFATITGKGCNPQDVYRYNIYIYMYIHIFIVCV